jgi:hypothetical protein
MQDNEDSSNRSSPLLGVPYVYDKLPHDNSFRHLILQPGVGNEPLKCSLCTAPLPQISFEAISYVWGKDLKEKHILCDGHVIKITVNLFNVLQRLRLPDASRKLWADGICINQDVKEKGHQVAIMGQIYRLAKRVLIYIGPDNDGYGPQLCSLLNKVDEMIETTCQSIDMTPYSFPYPEANDPLLLDSRWKSMYYLLEHDWFRRGWVVREASLAQIGLIVWGSSEFDWGKLMRVYMWLTVRAWRTSMDNMIGRGSVRLHCSAYAREHRTFANALSMYRYASQSLLLDLDLARYLRLSDARDRIYAFMELSNHNHDAISITPDYNLPTMDVYRQFAIEYTRCTASTQILDYVVHPAGALDLSVASWIPRWDVPQRSMVVDSSGETCMTSRHDSVYQPVLVDDSTFRSRGVLWDSVRYTSDVLMFRSTTVRVLAKIWEDIKPHTKECPYGPNQMLDAFLNTLYFGQYAGELISWRKFRKAFKNKLRLFCELRADECSHQHNSATGEDAEMEDYLYNVRLLTNQRKFVITERGYIGMAYEAAQQGDICGIIFGCRIPCILRPTAQEGFFSFLGGAYVTGKETYGVEGDDMFCNILGEKYSKDWVDWDVEEQDISLV